MKWTVNQLIYFTYSIISFIFLALWSAEASFIPVPVSWEIIGVFLILFLALPLALLLRRKNLFYELAIKNKGGLYSQAVCLFILQYILILNQKDAFLNTPHIMELYTWMLTLALFLSIIRVIRPLTFEEWSSK
tara:strand:- start:480 stop:878 length:399 start_codon:yes stop_codon:yes gene_type:complete